MTEAESARYWAAKKEQHQRALDFLAEARPAPTSCEKRNAAFIGGIGTLSRRFIKKNDYIGMKADEKRTINADALLADAIALREKSERQREEVRRLKEDARRKAEGKK